MKHIAQIGCLERENGLSSSSLCFQSGGDRVVGAGLLLFSISVFVYYTCWVLVLVSTAAGAHIRCVLTCACLMQPFVEPGHFFHSFFPDRYWAVVIPVVLMILGVTLIGSFLGLVMLRKGKPKKA